MIDLSHVGVGPHPAAPVCPPREWSGVPLSAHSLVKGHRVWVGALEPFAYALGLGRLEVVRLRSVLLVLEAAVYEWDFATENVTARTPEACHDSFGGALGTVLEDLVTPTQRMREDVADLAELFRLERQAVTAGGEPLFLAMSRVRSADVRLAMRVMMVLTGRGDPAAVDVMRPAMEILEVVDDLESVGEDRRVGGFNSFECVRAGGSRAEARRILDAFAADRSRQFRAAVAAAEPPIRRLVLAASARPGSPTSASALRAVAGLPEAMTLRLLDTAVLPRLAGAFRPYWARSELSGD